MANTPNRRSMLSGCALAALALVAPLAQAQSAWPAKPVKIVVPYGPGGAVDVVTRKMAQKLTEQTGQSFFVENKAGATGTIGASQVAKAEADGYTLMANDTTFSLLPHIFRKLPFDAAVDLVPVGAFVFAPMGLAVNAQSPFRTLADLVAEARRQPNKITYGTGGFMLLNTGSMPVANGGKLLTTIAYGVEGRVDYAIEGTLFVAGAAITWLRDKLGIITHASQTAAMAASLPDNGGVYLVPAFVGLGAPHWQAEARGLITGMTLDSGAAHIVRAALEAIAYQTADLVTAMMAQGAEPLRELRIDGGMASNDWFCQFLADVLDIAVLRPPHLETTALGAAMLAGHQCGAWPSLFSDAAAGAAARFAPRMAASERRRLRTGWHEAICRTLPMHGGASHQSR